jgi:GrpB-like predicted nucleotidyltransferase (UPF0157 family)
MTFPDEDVPVALVSPTDQWREDYGEIAQALRRLSLSDVGMIEHVGSTSIPDLVAADVIDVQIRVPDLDADLVVSRFVAAGFRHRPEPWNSLEPTRMGVYPKLVFAPALGARRANIHVRPNGSPGAQDTLLFRDYLCAEDEPRRRWGELKTALVQSKDVDPAAYDEAKRAPWLELMADADKWALIHEWRPRPLARWSAL